MIKFFFFFFLFLTIICGIFVILSDNAINSVLSLIGCFINSSIVLLCCGLDFFALVFVAIYVSVIAILFLFILMFLNIPYSFKNNWLLNLSKLFLLFLLFHFIFTNYFLPEINTILYLKPARYTGILNILDYTNSVDVIATYLYTDYMIYLILAAIILFFAMLGAIMILQQYQFNWAVIFKQRGLRLSQLLKRYRK
jgi:NADH:ubiquinone oxidoreductase subunit 6 (subunit J)